MTEKGAPKVDVTETYLRDVSRQLGVLTATMQNIDRRASEDRGTRIEAETRMLAYLDTLEKRQHLHAAQLEELDTRMKHVEPVVEGVTGFKARVTGAVFVMGLIGSVVITIFTVFKEQAAAALRSITGA